MSVAANEGLFQVLRKDGIMMGAFERVFHEDIARWEARGEERGEARGRRDGIAIGRDEGRRDGIAIGRDEGRNEERKTIMDKLIAIGWDPIKAASFTGVSV
ncbi:MAG: hypothetical protein IJ702_08190 [Fretibacterium sp.]|nr:hypothetical protein [Fretibacterium sp.]